MKVYLIIFIVFVVLAIGINVFATILEKVYKKKMQKISEENEKK